MYGLRSLTFKNKNKVNNKSLKYNPVNKDIFFN